MAAKKAASASDRTDPKKNKSLAIRNVISKLPGAKAAEIVEAVKKEYGHSVNLNMVYMVKTKSHMAADGRPKTKKMKSKSGDTPMISPALWVEAIGISRQLLKCTGSLANAIALLKAVDA
jgi:hypothetical protein